jgi:membrane fusion protein (multidrug efflux system)
VGDWSGEDWIILGGLNAGDQVIVDGVVKARPGSPVKIAQVPAANSAQPGQAPAAKPGAQQPAKQ